MTLVDEFGMDLMRLCQEDPGQVAACAGVPIESVHRVAEQWAKHAGRITAASELKIQISSAPANTT